MRILALCLSFALGAPASAAEARGDAPIVKPVVAWADVDAGGRVTGLDFDQAMPTPIRELAEATFLGLAFEPATRGGKPVPSRTAVSTRLEFTADGAGGFVTKVLSIHQPGSHHLEMTPPRYPAGPQRDGVGGVIWLDLRVGPDGRIAATDIEIHASRFHRDGKPYSGPLGGQLADAARDAASRWRFEQPQVAGQPIATLQRVPVTFTPPGYDDRRWKASLGGIGGSQTEPPRPAQDDFRLARLIETETTATQN